MGRKRFFEYLATSLLYESKETIFSRLNPATKLIYIVIVFAVAFLATNIVQLLYFLIINIGIVIFCKVLRRKFFDMLKGLWLFIIFIILFNILVTYLLGDTDIASALLYQSYALTRIFIILPPILIFISTTTPLEIIQLFSKLGIKYYYLYPIVIAYRFIPIVFQEMKNVYDAQRSRGVELEKGDIREKIRKLSSVVVPTIVCSFIRAKDLSEALILRGFGYKDKRTFYRELKLSKIDAVFLCTIVLVYIVPFISWYILNSIT